MTDSAVATTEPTATDTKHSDLGGQYLTFLLNGEEYGVDVLKVRELIGLHEITEVPLTAEYLKGVINLRGKVIPVIDLRLKFGMAPAEYTEHTCIVVVDVGSHIGVIVDTVREVYDIEPEDIAPPPEIGELESGFILGVGKVRDDLKLLLDVDEVLRADDLLEDGSSGGE